ncbi:CYTH and CHAD domain-containing protein [Nonomuraea jiangxiensis]|uniref:CHAD domain-containing protein n=1 Tax=Nonomuraea jiangxiensis TaxID=633440 RepID=A0A1G9F9E6_9ACTN|nr:CYTH and CHAD domain-containing protein [Nonomuraea jiangxiensis]SDK85019.1 CHAD domain-containing protein [Nonomuraea jiangxiensis]
MAQHTEIERKYEIDDGAAIVIESFAGPDGPIVADEPRTWRLVADYVDTPGLALAAHGITLRRRDGGEDAGWHLKLPTAKDTRQEVHEPLGVGVHHVPARLAALVAAHVRGQELVPVATVETTRTTRRLRDRDGQVVAEIADDVVVGHRLDDHAERSASWHEVEIELVNGSPELLESLDPVLRQAGAVPAAASSKLRRVLGDDLAARPRRTPGRTAGEALIAYLRRQRDRLLTYDPLVRLADHDDDSVHKMRVAVRRMRSLLRTHARLLDRAQARALDAELKWLADTLGDVRDLEVLTARFDRRLADRPAGLTRGDAPRWPGQLATREREARRRLKDALSTPRYFALLARLDDFLADPPFTARAGRKARRLSPRLVVKSWCKVLDKYARAERLPTGTEREHALHSTRKAAKRARYTAEAATPALGKPAAKLARRAEDLQEALGRYQDAIVAQRQLTEIAERPGPSPDDAFTLGLLLGTERGEAADALRDLPPARRHAARTAKQLRALKR